MIRRATYRLQFRKEFGFDQAAALAPYLARLGISHVYSSPFLKARPDSTHGYDIVDNNALNPELGDEAAFDRMNAALADNGLRQILDFVPNHMGVGGADNRLWLNVLEWGGDSAYAGWFDIDWNPEQSYLRDKLLAPSLGEQYGAALEAGKLTLKFDAEEGEFAIWAYDAHKLPIRPIDYGMILGDAHPELERLGDSFSSLLDWRHHAQLRAGEMKAELARLARERADVSDAIDAAIARISGAAGDLSSWMSLDALIKRQNWRVAHFRVAADDINYRRFFDINDLAGVRMEIPEVFAHAHRLVLRLMKEGVLDGLRIDHIDGLLDPKHYIDELRDNGGNEFYLVVEKILASHESLREDWQVQGTTGYEFTNLVLGLLVDPAGEAGFSRAYEHFTRQRESFATTVTDCKLRITRNEMASELNALARRVARLARQNPRTADFTHNIVRRAIGALAAAFPVYRTYLDTRNELTDADRRDLDWAFAQARRIEPDIDQSVFDFLARLFSGDLVGAAGSGFSRHGALRCAMALQQYSGPVMAKGLEDTAFYRYNRFIALNEVGGHPDQFGVSIAAFHNANRQRAKRWPNAMLATSTHDTKRGEDTRARLAALSEWPEEWARQCALWSRVLRARRGDVEGLGPPDRNDEYMFYQLLIGSWLVELFGEAPDAASLEIYAARIKGALTKSIREAKLRSTWAAPNKAYEDEMLAFADLALSPGGSGSFFAAFAPFAQRIARLGAHNSLVQTVIKLTAPGMPDIYQGSELWDLTLVDPDNRRPIDYELRARLLDEVLHALGEDRADAMARFMRNWQDARFKLAATVTLLDFRRAAPDLFATGDYEAVAVEGGGADQVCAYLRRQGETALLTVAARFPRRLEESGLDAVVLAPESLEGVEWRDLLTGRTFAGGAGGLDASSLLRDLPAAVLVTNL
jgi:(1->4)-alpha-D-glucan 1-alpha-D-glucosylmutase